MNINTSIQNIQELVEIALDRELEQFTLDADWYEHYGMDSLGAVALAVELQKRYRLRIRAEQMPAIRNGRQLKELIEQKLQEINSSDS